MMARPRPGRGGWALMECLVLISVMTILLGLCAGTIRLLLKLDRAGRAARDQASDIQRLADDFRDDVHAASGPPSRPSSGDRLTLGLPGGRTVEYATRPAAIARIVREGEKIRRSESYRRPPRSTIRFEVPAGNPIASLLIDPEPGAEASSLSRDCRIEAELGKDRRLSTGPR